jgi:hypothetical protein
MERRFMEAAMNSADAGAFSLSRRGEGWGEGETIEGSVPLTRPLGPTPDHVRGRPRITSGAGSLPIGEK